MDASRTTHSGASTVRPLRLLRLARLGLSVSILSLALAPLAVTDGYSLLHNTLSESGGQGVSGAFAHRGGVVITAVSVWAMTVAAANVWARSIRNLFRVYSAALVGLVVFPEAAWDGRPFDETVATLHTVFAVVGAGAFIVAALLLARSRPGAAMGTRTFDILVAFSIALIPQVMLVSSADGIWQRVMVTLGYVWLFLESARIEARLRPMK